MVGSLLWRRGAESLTDELSQTPVVVCASGRNVCQKGKKGRVQQILNKRAKKGAILKIDTNVVHAMSTDECECLQDPTRGAFPWVPTIRVQLSIKANTIARVGIDRNWD